jgi:hypothetical protein
LGVKRWALNVGRKACKKKNYDKELSDGRMEKSVEE